MDFSRRIASTGGATFRLELCRPMASGLPIKVSGDFGRSPIFGQLLGQAILLEHARKLRCFPSNVYFFIVSHSRNLLGDARLRGFKPEHEIEALRGFVRRNMRRLRYQIQSLREFGTLSACHFQAKYADRHIGRGY